MSASQLLFGTPAKAAIAPYSGIATLAAGGPGALLQFTLPFPVSQNTLISATPLGRAQTGAIYVTRGFGAAGVGTITINSNNAGDAGLLVMVQVWNAGAEGF